MLLLCPCTRSTASIPASAPAIAGNARVGTKRKVPCVAGTSRPAPMAATSARQNASSANASASTPTFACCRTFATVAAARLRVRASSVSSHASASGRKYGAAPAAVSTSNRPTSQVRPPTSHSACSPRRARCTLSPFAACQRCDSMNPGSTSCSS